MDVDVTPEEGVAMTHTATALIALVVLAGLMLIVAGTAVGVVLLRLAVRLLR